MLLGECRDATETGSTGRGQRMLQGEDRYATGRRVRMVLERT